MANAQYGVFEEHQKRALRKVLVEERSRYCTLLNLLQPVVVSTIYYPMFFSMHLQVSNLNILNRIIILSRLFILFVQEQEVSLLSDAENLASLLEEASRQCEKPGILPEAGERMIEEFRTADVVGLFDDQVKNYFHSTILMC